MNESQRSGIGGETLVLKPDAFKWLGFTVLFLLALSIGWVTANKGSWLGIVAAVFGFVGAVTSLAWGSLRRFHLSLNPSGFAFGNLQRRFECSWGQVTRFSVGKARCGNFDIVQIEHADEVWKDFAQLLRTNKRAIPPPGCLPDTYGLGSDKLASLLEDWRKKYSSNQVQKTDA